MTTPVMTTDEQLDFHLWAQELREHRIEQRAAPPIVRFFDGDYNERGPCASELSATFQWKVNETGNGQIVLPIDRQDKRGTYLAHWIINEEQRQTRNVHVCVDKDGARWPGRMRKATLKRSPNGDTVVVDLAHDFAELEFTQIWSNPFTPAILQFPRVFCLAGPSRYMLKLALFLNLLRLNLNLWQLPDDPLDPASWTAGLNMYNWPVVVKPHAITDDSSVWTLLSSRFKTWTDMAATTLDTAELVVECRRYLEGDEPPWPGANLKPGTLVIDVVDKGGVDASQGATGFGGALGVGLKRTIAGWADGFLDETVGLVTDMPDDPQYRVAGWLGTMPAAPWVVYQDSELTGIQSSELVINPGTVDTLNVGGHSMPGVNEGISAGMQLAGNLIGTALSGGTFQTGGVIADTIAKPLYTDTVLAWWSAKLPLRSQHLGHHRYREIQIQGGDKAFTLSSLVALTAAAYATRATTSHTLTISDAGPYLIGDNGNGHWFLGDRIGSTNMYTGDKVYVDRCTELTLAWSRDKAPTWQAVIGDLRAQQEPFARAISMIRDMMGTLHDLGVM